MHIILGEQNVQEVEDKYVVLELDTFHTVSQGEPVSAFCLIENIPIQELPQVDQYRDLHRQLIKNYRAANWKFCEDAIEHLQGRWNGEVDSFYEMLSARIQQQKTDPISQNWDPVIRIG
jgi:hypothetical protein